jgi:hypothetical protein
MVSLGGGKCSCARDRPLKSLVSIKKCVIEEYVTITEIATSLRLVLEKLHQCKPRRFTVIDWPDAPPDLFGLRFIQVTAI